MATAIKMPALGESVTEGTVSAWLKQVGDTVEADEPIVEVATDKVDSEVPSPVAGTLVQILVEEDDTVEVGTVIAMIGDAGETPAPAAQTEPAAPAEVPSPVQQTAPAEVVEAPAPASNAGDTTEVTMPALGESVTEGTVSAWLKQVGDTVEADEPIVEVATDKVDSEVPSPVSGILAEIRVAEDETVNVGEVIAVIGSEVSTPSAEAAPAPSQAPVPVTPAAEPAPPSAPPAPAAAPTPPTPPAPPAPAWANAPTHNPGDAQAVLDDLATRAAASGTLVREDKPSSDAKVYVTPLVRKLAREQGVDLASVTGTGVGGRIRKEDVMAAAEAARHATVATPQAEAPSRTVSAPEDSPRGTTVKMSRLRQTVARRMVESLQTAAQLTTVVEVDVTKVAALRARSKDEFLAKHGTKLTFLPFFVKAATEALVQHPKLNAQINDREVTYFDYENIGIAVDTERGLMVPVIKNAGELDIAGIADSINTLAEKARTGKISPDELTGSTFTITNTGSGGALFDTPVLNMPEVGILGVGTIVKRPVVVTDADGKEAIAVHSMVYLSLTYDHRLVDGADAARYLMSVKKRLEEADFTADL